MNISLEDENIKYEIIDPLNLPSLLPLQIDKNDPFINDFNIVSLKEILFVGNKEENVGRLSLAYENLRTIPKVINEIAQNVKILDLSYNNFENLNFLSNFENLETLICDHNKITSYTYIPFLPKLEFLWLNYCKINELYPWASRLQNSCPNLLHLSLMGNPVAPSFSNGKNNREYFEYRYFMISLFPSLIYLDDRSVTADQRRQSQKMYHEPIFDNSYIKNSNNITNRLRFMLGKITNICSPVSPFQNTQKNSII